VTLYDTTDGAGLLDSPARPRGGKRAGAGRKPGATPPRQVVSYTLPPALVPAVAAAAKALGMSASAFVEAALVAALKDA
jgi:hypothetical protein